MKKFYLKEAIESILPPKNTHLLWVNTDDKTGDLKSVKKFKDGEWKTEVGKYFDVNDLDPSKTKKQFKLRDGIHYYKMHLVMTGKVLSGVVDVVYRCIRENGRIADFSLYTISANGLKSEYCTNIKLTTFTDGSRSGYCFCGTVTERGDCKEICGPQFYYKPLSDGETTYSGILVEWYNRNCTENETDEYCNILNSLYDYRTKVFNNGYSEYCNEPLVTLDTNQNFLESQTVYLSNYVIWLSYTEAIGGFDFTYDTITIADCTISEKAPETDDELATALNDTMLGEDTTKTADELIDLINA